MCLDVIEPGGPQLVGIWSSDDMELAHTKLHWNSIKNNVVSIQFILTFKLIESESLIDFSSVSAVQFAAPNWIGNERKVFRKCANQI